MVKKKLIYIYIYIYTAIFEVTLLAILTKIKPNYYFNQ